MNIWPQYVVAISLVARLFWHLISDQKVAKQSERASAVLASFLVFGLSAGVLWAGGFWEPFYHGGQ